MKKTLVALAALAATGAFAQSSVTISGNLDQTYYRQTAGGNTASNIISNGNSTSTLSLMGAEDLGGGLKAKFDLTAELSLKEGQVGSTTTGTAANNGQKTDFFTRGANIALESSKFGTFTVGRQKDLWFEAGAYFNNSGSNSFGFATTTATMSNSTSMNGFNTAYTTTPVGLGGYSGVNPAGGTNGALYTSTGVANNGNTGTAIAFTGGITYATPVFSGFQGKIQKSGTNFGDNGAQTDGIGYSLSYNNGPLKLAYAYSGRNDSNGNMGWENAAFGGSYNLGAWTFIAAQNKTSFSNAAASNHNMTSNGVGVNYELNSNVDMNLAYTTLSDDVDSTYKTAITAVTARYKLSKRTQLYAGIGSGSNDGATNKFSLIYGGSNATTTGAAGTNAVMMGIRHAF